MCTVQASLKFWLEHGVDGFRFYGVQYLVESNNWTQADVAVGTASCVTVSLRLLCEVSTLSWYL